MKAQMQEDLFARLADDDSARRETMVERQRERYGRGSGVREAGWGAGGGGAGGGGGWGSPAGVGSRYGGSWRFSEVGCLGGLSGASGVLFGGLVSGASGCVGGSIEE